MLQIYFLGPPWVELNGAPVKLSRRNAPALLSHLAVSGAEQPRDKLSTPLWPEYGQWAARKAMHYSGDRRA